jgi:DinB superfamily
MSYGFMNELPELLERFRRGAELVAVAITGAAGPELDFKPAPDKWSVRQIVAHLADGEAANVVRLRQVIAEENPTLVPFDQNAWAERTNYDQRKPSQALETMRQLRADNYQLLKDLPAETYSRTGHHLKRGTMSLLDMLRLFAEHAERHAAQIREVRGAYKASRTKAAV